MVSKVNIILVASGSFNPITRIHLQMIGLAKKHLDSKPGHQLLQGIVSPVHDVYFLKKGQLVTSAKRIEMIELAIKEFNREEKLDKGYVVCDDWESSGSDWKNTLTVLKHFDDKFNNPESQTGPVQIRLLCGADLILSMQDPFIWPPESVKEIAKKFGFLVINRFAINLPQVIAENAVLNECAPFIEIVNNFPGNNDSSTLARQAIKDGKRPTDLLYESVCDYIAKHRLYI